MKRHIFFSFSKKEIEEQGLNIILNRYSKHGFSINRLVPNAMGEVCLLVMSKEQSTEEDFDMHEIENKRVHEIEVKYNYLRDRINFIYTKGVFFSNEHIMSALEDVLEKTK